MMYARTALLSVLCLSFASQAQLIDVSPESFRPPDTFPPPHRHISYAVESRHVDIQVRNQVASVTVTETLLNTCGRAFEAEYYLPLPTGAMVDQLTLTVNGREMTGEILSASDARRRYEDIVRRRRDPALLEYAGFGCIRVSAFPLEPNKPAKLTIHYSMLCPRDGNVVELQFPLATARHSSAPVKEVAVTADIHGQAELINIYSPTVDIRTEYRGERRAVVTYSTRDCYPSSDFVVYYSEDNADIGATFLTYFPERDKDGYYMMLVSPGRKTNSQSPLAKDVLLVLDRSGSMSGEKIAQARDAASFVINNLNSEDRFDVITYNDAVESTFGSLASATNAHRQIALADVGMVQSGGGTNIHDALLTAMNTLVQSGRQASLGATEARPAYVFFLTDGLPTVGVTNEQQIIDGTRAANDMQARLFCFGVGYDVNVRLLDNLANDQKGKSTYVKPEEDIEVKVSSLYSKVKNPVMTNLQADVTNFRLRDRQPNALSDLFENDQIVQVGRIACTGAGQVQTELVITGLYQGEAQEFSYPVELNTLNRRSSYKFIEKLWAQRRVAFLLNEVRLKGNIEELVDEITDLATRYGIVTPYTSFLADENRGLSNVRENRLDVSSKSLTLHKQIMGAASQAVSESFDQSITAKRPTIQRDVAVNSHGSAAANETMRVIGGEIFYKRGDYWILSSLAYLDIDKDLGQFTHITRYSDDYFALMSESAPDESALLSGQREGEKFLVSLCGQTYVIE